MSLTQSLTPLPPLTQIPASVASLSDYEALARERVSDAVWAWLNGGSADEITLKENSAAYQRLFLQNRILKNLQGGHTRVELFGQTYEYPIFLAPVSYHRMLHAEGELATVMGASALKAGMVVSTYATYSIEDVARASTSPLWFQLYMRPERAETELLVRRAEAAGYKAIVVTVDAPVNGIRNQEQRAGFSLPADIRAVNLNGFTSKPAWVAVPGESPVFGSHLLADAPGWDDVAWLCQSTSLPVLLKGITSAHDARLALAAGASGIIVSNHGGRVLDGMPATIDSLSAVVGAVRNQVPVLVDGGIRRGTDIVKALALGASAVLIGRPYLHGLAAAGAAGVAHVLHILRTELEVAMALTGCATLADITEEVIFRQ